MNHTQIRIALAEAGLTITQDTWSDITATRPGINVFFTARFYGGGWSFLLFRGRDWVAKSIDPSDPRDLTDIIHRELPAAVCLEGVELVDSPDVTDALNALKVRREPFLTSSLWRRLRALITTPRSRSAAVRCAPAVVSLPSKEEASS